MKKIIFRLEVEAEAAAEKDNAVECENIEQCVLDALGFPENVIVRASVIGKTGMTEGQYRAIIGYLTYWPRRHPELNLDTAIADIGITDSRDAVISELFKCCYDWDDEARHLSYRP